MTRVVQFFLRFCFIDDDADNRRQWLEWGQRRAMSVSAFGRVVDAIGTPADVFVIDVSAVASVSAVNLAYAPLCRLMNDHPGAVFVISSCMSRNAVEAVLDDIEIVAGRRPLFCDASEGFRGLDRVLEFLI